METDPEFGGTVINLYVGNLPFTTTSDELAALFGRVGEVTSAQVITDRETGRSRGFGFVEMSDEDARKAIEELTGADFAGRAITVNEARPRAPRTGGGDRGGYAGGGRRDGGGGGNYGGGGNRGGGDRSYGGGGGDRRY